MPRKLKIPRCYYLAYSPCGQQLVTSYRDVFLWDATTGKKVWSARPLKHPSRLAFDAHGELLAVKNTHGDIVILDARSGELRQRLLVPKPSEGSNVFFTEDREFLISGTWDGKLEKYRLVDGELVDSVAFEDQMVTQICPVHSSQEVVVQHGRASKVYLSRFSVSLRGGSRGTVSLPDHTKQFAILPDGQVMSLGMRSIRVQNGETTITLFEAKEFMKKFCVNNAGDVAAVVHADTITVIQIASGTARPLFQLPLAWPIAFSPRNDELVIGSGTSGVVVFDASEIRKEA